MSIIRRICLASSVALLFALSVAAQAAKRPAAGDTNLSITAIARQAKASVGMLIVSDEKEKQQFIGSCFVISADGRVVTNYHVVSEGASALVKFPNGAYFGVRGVIAADPAHDLAVLQLDGSEFSPVTLAPADRSAVGDAVVAIGNPEELEYTVSNGIVSALRRATADLPELIQITAPIAHGSSGGPLFNMRGQVIGVTTLTHTEAQNANFAVPVSYVHQLLRASGAPVDLEDIESVTYTAPTTEHASPAAKPSPLPKNWVSLQSGSDFRLMRDGKYLYVEYLSNDDTKFLCELTAAKEDWKGVCRWTQTVTCPGAINFCPLEQPYSLRFVTPSRIEATIAIPSFLCGKGCSVVRTDSRHVTLIPKD